jgi:hypothetical protein
MKLKIDTNGTSFVATRLPEQRVTFDTGQPRIDRETGLPLWQVQVMALDASGADIIAVTVPGDVDVKVGQPVQLAGLIAVPWNQEGRSGIAFRAESITALGPQLADVAIPPKPDRPTSAGSTSKSVA